MYSESPPEGAINKLAAGMTYDTFLHTTQEVHVAIAAGKPVVTMCYQAFCEPCRSTKHYIEEFARKHGFFLIRVDAGLNWQPESAGELIPYVQILCVDGPVSPPLYGAQTAVRIKEWLTRYGVIQANEDPGLAILRSFIAQVQRRFGDSSFTVREVIACANDSGHPGFEDLRHILIQITGDMTPINGQRLAHWIKKHQGEVVDGYRIVKAPITRSSVVWRIEQITAC